MEIKNVGLWLMVVSIAVIVGSVIYLKKTKQMVEKPLVYGLLATFAVQSFALLFVMNGDFMINLMNAGFLALISLNMINLFGFRMSKIGEKDKRSLHSYFVGNAIIGNALSFTMLGISSIAYESYVKDFALQEKIGAEMMDLMAEMMSLITLDHIGILLVSTLASVVVMYCALLIFVRAFQTKHGRTNWKGILVLFSYYLVTLYVPVLKSQEWMQMLLYIAVSVAAYFFVKQVQQEKITPKVPQS